MPIAPVIRLDRPPGLPSIAATILIASGLFFMLRGDSGGGAEGAGCDPGDTSCEAGASDFAPVPTAPELSASEVCRGAGYLCAELEETGRIRVGRWKDFEGTMVVHVPRPDFEDIGTAIRLQNAASAGVRAWNGQPFPIQVDTRGDRPAHFAVSWTQSLGGQQLGVARTRWSLQRGLEVVSIELTTRSPFDHGVLDPRQVRLTAAHEMGHALGLPHSDSRADVMYPTNSSTTLSAQDYRTMEVLYQLEDGTVIVP